MSIRQRQLTGPAKNAKSTSHAPAAMCALDVVGLTVRRCHAPVLNDVHLTIRLGETVAVMGPNGAGKSTLLKSLAGQILPHAGAIRWLGVYKRCDSHVRRRIGFVGHEQGLYPDLTAAENLLFAARMHGVAKPHAIVQTSLARAELESAGRRLAGQLSQGMRQRLAILRATIHDPEIILLDEPFVSLDANGRDCLANMFRLWRDAGRTVCFVSHDEGQAHALADRRVLFDAGRIAADSRMHPDHLPMARSA